MIAVVGELEGIGGYRLGLDLPEPAAFFRNQERRIDVAGHFDFKDTFFRRKADVFLADDNRRRFTPLIDRNRLLTRSAYKSQRTAAAVQGFIGIDLERQVRLFKAFGRKRMDPPVSV